MWKYIARLCCAIRAYRGQVWCENLRKREREREREEKWLSCFWLWHQYRFVKTLAKGIKEKKRWNKERLKKRNLYSRIYFLQLKVQANVKSRNYFRMDDNSKLIFSNTEFTNKNVACWYTGQKHSEEKADIFFRVTIYWTIWCARQSCLQWYCLWLVLGRCKVRDSTGYKLF